MATCLENKDTAITSYDKLFFLQNSFNALNSSSSHLSLIRNSSKINIVLSSIIFLQFSKAHIVEEYKSASKNITDAIRLRSEKKMSNVSSNFPKSNSPQWSENQSRRDRVLDQIT